MDKKVMLKSRISKILQEEEFSEALTLLKEQLIKDISQDINDRIIVKKVSDEEIRDEIRGYFTELFDDNIENIEEMTHNISTEDYNKFGTYNDYVDRFRVVFDSLNLPQDKKEELFSAVASISNYSVYNLMLLRSITNAVYDTLDKETSDKIFNKAIFNVENETSILIKDISNSEKTGKSLKELESEKKRSNVVSFDFSKTDKRISGFKN